MNVSGPTPISPRMDDPAATLRLHQRFEAEVLQVAGERVTLSVAGVSIVARMTSTEQAAILTQHRRATFQVQEAGPEMKLKLVTASSAPGAEGLRIDVDPAVELLRQAGLPPDETNLQLARACLQNHVAITKAFITQTRSVLEQALGPPGQEKGGAPGGAASGSASLAQAAQTAVSWAATGRALTPATLSLLLQELPDFTNLVASLRSGLASARSRLSPEDAALLDQAIQWLDALAVDLPSDGDLAEKLQKAIRLMGRSLEAELAGKGLRPSEEDNSGLYSLAQLSRRLDHGEPAALKAAIEQLLGRLNQQNLRNTPAPQAGAQEQWLALEIPCSLAHTPGSPNSALDQSELPVHLRILKKNQSEDQPDGHSGSRFIIQAEAAPGKVIEVDLSILERRVQVYVSAPDADISGRAAEEMDGLSQGLTRLGYEVQNAVIGVKETPAQRPNTDAQRGAVSGPVRHTDWRA
jgi:hypothetical protein